LQTITLEAFRQRFLTPNFSLYSQEKCGDVFDFEIMQEKYENFKNNENIVNEINNLFIKIVDFYQLAAKRDEMVLLHLT
jgi:hypothetical protein